MDLTTVPGVATLRLAAVGTAAPATEVATPTGFRDVGTTTEDGTSWNSQPTFGQLNQHQSPYPRRRWKILDAQSLIIVLEEWTGENFIATYGGGTVTAPSTGHYKYVPPGPADSVPTAALLDWIDIDGDKHYRLVIPKARMVSPVNIPLQRTQAALLPLQLDVEGAQSVDPWYLLTDDPEFEPA